jgi:hypothetical protein
VPTPWKDRKRPTMRNTKPIASVECEIIKLADAAAQRQGMSRAAYISSLVRRDVGRISGLGTPVWPAAVMLSRALAMLSFAQIANDQEQAVEVRAWLRSAQSILGEALAKMREPLADAIAERLRMAGGGDVWGTDTDNA